MNNTILLRIACLALFSCSNDFELGNDNTFIKAFGNMQFTDIRSIKNLPGGGFAVVGVSTIQPFTATNDNNENFERSKSIPVLIVFDKFGNEQWHRLYNIDRYTSPSFGIKWKIRESVFTDVGILSNGYFIVVGTNFDIEAIDLGFTFPESTFMFLTDENGKVILEHYFEGDPFPLYQKVIQLNNGNLALLSRRTRVFDGSSSPFSIAVIDQDAEILFSRTYKGELEDPGYFTFVQDGIGSSRGELVICGNQSRLLEGSSDDFSSQAFVMRIDQNNGDIIAEAYYGDTFHNARSITELPDGGYVFAQEFRPLREDNPRTVAITTVDENLNELRTVPVTQRESDLILNIVTTSDGNLVIQGDLFEQSRTPTAGDPTSFTSRSYLIKADLDGNIKWRVEDPSNMLGLAVDLVATPDGGIVSLQNAIFGALGLRGLLIKMNSDGKI